MAPAHAAFEARQPIRQRGQRLPVRNRDAAVLRAVDRARELLPGRTHEQLRFERVGEVGEDVEIEAAGASGNLPVDLRVDAAGAQATQVQIRRRDRVDTAGGRIAPQGRAERVGRVVGRVGAVEVVALAQRRAAGDRRDHIADVDVVVVHRERQIREQRLVELGVVHEAEGQRVGFFRRQIRVAAVDDADRDRRVLIGVDDRSRNAGLRAERADAGAIRAGPRRRTHVAGIALARAASRSAPAHRPGCRARRCWAREWRARSRRGT